jgi:hypothetical protein
MLATQTPTLEQWLLLGVFFLLFAIYGFTKNTRGSGCRPCSYIVFGLLAVLGNSLLLLIANRAGMAQFELLQLIMLKQATIESSFIVLGYCLIVQGIAMLIRSMFVPASVKASRNFF